MPVSGWPLPCLLPRLYHSGSLFRVLLSPRSLPTIPMVKVSITLHFTGNPGEAAEKSTEKIVNRCSQGVKLSWYFVSNELQSHRVQGKKKRQEGAGRRKSVLEGRLSQSIQGLHRQTGSRLVSCLAEWKQAGCRNYTPCSAAGQSWGRSLSQPTLGSSLSHFPPSQVSSLTYQ